MSGECKAAPKRYLPADSAARKRMPLARGLLDYFPDACAAVAEVSFQGNEKHNPGQPLHHARGKSNDHADCIMRHLTERGGFDGDTRHSAALAWRAMALLQEELEAEFGLSLPRGATAPGVELPADPAPPECKMCGNPRPGHKHNCPARP